MDNFSMGIISSLYKKHFVSRYDKEIGVPYYSPNDFKDLRYEEHQFINSNGNECFASEDTEDELPLVEYKPYTNLSY